MVIFKLLNNKIFLISLDFLSNFLCTILNLLYLFSSFFNFFLNSIVNPLKVLNFFVYS